jgi:hypothetical protein
MKMGTRRTMKDNDFFAASRLMLGKVKIYLSDGIGIGRVTLCMSNFIH